VAALEERTRGAAGVVKVGSATRAPLQVGGAQGFFFQVEGYEAARDEELRLDAVFATPGYLEALGLPVLAGRPIVEADGAASENVVVVNRGMAERYWPDDSAVGGLLRISDQTVRVVGVVENATWNGLAEEVTNYVYAPLAQSPERASAGFMTIVARVSGEDAAAVLPFVRAQAGTLERDLSFEYQSTMESMVSEILMPQRMGAILLSAFGLLALALSAVGIAGVVSYTVSRQRRDIGVRVALGATRIGLLASVMAEMAVPITGGLLLGIIAAVGLSPTLEGFLFRVSPTDPAAYVTIALAVGTVSLVATWLPARSAARVDPVEVLRAD
jgi:putative ABC transport system permease protein